MSYRDLVGIFWIIFLAVWFVSAFGVKKDIGKTDWRKSAWIRLLVAVAAVVFLSIHPSKFLNSLFAHHSTNGEINLIGTILCGLGIALAVWARWHLGRNWSSHPDIKQDHELVTSGPYSVVRHPIYTGMIVAFIGTAMVIGLFWLIVFVCATAAFIWRIRIEEGYMTQLFPDRYPAYKRRTWALVPYIF